MVGGDPIRTWFLQYSLRSKRSGIVEIQSQQHDCSIGSSTQSPPIKTLEVQSPFPDVFDRGVYIGSIKDLIPKAKHAMVEKTSRSR